MYKTHKQEEFSRAYIHALAAPLGFNMARFNQDDDSIDVVFIAKYPTTSVRRSPQIDFQLKCTKSTFSKDDTLHFPLSAKNYHDLRGTNLPHPRYLVVLCVPELERDWLEIKPEEMILRYSAYWYSLKDAPVMKNKKGVIVKIPKANKLDKKSFKFLMDKASEGIAL